MKAPFNQGVRRGAYVDTHKMCNTEWKGLSCLPEGFEPERTVLCLAHPFKASGLAAAAALHPIRFGSNASSLNSIGRP